MRPFVQCGGCHRHEREVKQIDRQRQSGRKLNDIPKPDKNMFDAIVQAPRAIEMDGG
jgi:cell division FtsZ-interacting protein ZapD